MSGQINVGNVEKQRAQSRVNQQFLVKEVDEFSDILSIVEVGTRHCVSVFFANHSASDKR